MDDWESILRLQRMMDELEPLRKHLREIEQMRRYMPVSQPMIAAVEYQRQLETIRTLSDRFGSLFQFEQQLAAATKALPDLRHLSAIDESTAVFREFERINQAIRDARLIGAFEIDEDDNLDEVETTESTDRMSQIEERLVGVVSSEEFQRLQRVDFAPFRLLESVLKDPEAMRALSAREFEEFIASLVDRLGFKDVILTPKSRDRGRDVIATAYFQDIPVVCAFECKRYSKRRPVGPDIARALLGVISHDATRASKGILVTTSYFTPAAQQFIITEPSLEGRDFDGIVEWMRRINARK